MINVKGKYKGKECTITDFDLKTELFIAEVENKSIPISIDEFECDLSEVELKEICRK